MPERHSGGPGSTPGGRTTTCRSGDQRRLQNAASAVRFRGTSPLHASAEDSKRSSKAHWVGSIPTGSTTPRSTSGEVIGFSSRSDGLDTHTRCPTSLPADPAALLRTRRAVVRLHPETLLALASGPGGDAPNVARRSSTLRESSSEHGAMVAHYFHTVGIGRFEYGARFHTTATSSDERALIRRRARARLPPPRPRLGSSNG